MRVEFRFVGYDGYYHKQEKYFVDLLNTIVQEPAVVDVAIVPDTVRFGDGRVTAIVKVVYDDRLEK